VTEFSLEIITPQQGATRRMVVSLNVPGTLGRLTVLAQHEPAFCLLQAGSVQWTLPSGNEEHYPIQGGLLAVEANQATLLVRNTNTSPQG
jgi:F-type H+-transporting ATPase subunit epsilon